MDAHAPQEEQQQQQQQQEQQEREHQQEYQQEKQEPQEPQPEQQQHEQQEQQEEEQQQQQRPRRQQQQPRQRQQRATNRPRLHHPVTDRRNIPLAPSWYGIVMTTTEALRLFEACLTGRLLHASRRPHDIERETLIRSGSVFIYEESACGIKRWTDGRKWSPSRILGNFLIYREMRKDAPSGNKKKAIKRKREGNSDDHNENTSLTDSTGPPIDEAQRALVGSLTNSYFFKEGGLMKKTLSVRYHNVWHHLVSYYSLEDATSGRLATPSQFPELRSIRPRRELIIDQDYRSPMHLEDPALLEEAAADMAMTGYGHGPQQHLDQAIPLPPMQVNMLQHYGVPAQAHPSLSMNQSAGPGLHMGGPFEHNTSNVMPWGHQALPQPTHHSYQLQGMVGSGDERRHTGSSWEASNTTADLLSPSGMAHGTDMTTTGHHYYAPPATTSYASPTTLSPTTMGADAMGFMSTATSMAPPPQVDVMPGLPVTTMEYSPPMSTMAPMPINYAHTQAPTGSLDSPVGGPTMNMPAMLSAQPGTALSGPNAEPQYFPGGWQYAHENNAYPPGPGSGMNGWPGGSMPGDQR